MAKLNLSIAVRDYDRTRPLSDGLRPDRRRRSGLHGADPEEIFFRAFRHAEFDICELSMSSFTVKTAQGNCPYVGVPAFVSRAFRHTSIYVRTDRIKKPADLKGKKIGVPEYQLTANVWARAILEDDHGVKPSDIHWVRGGLDGCRAAEKISITLPKDVKLDDIPEGRTLSAHAGRQVRSTASSGRACRPALPRRLRISAGCFPIRSLPRRTISSAPAFFRSCISSAFGESLAEQHPWLPGAVFKAFEQSKKDCLGKACATPRRPR